MDVVTFSPRSKSQNRIKCAVRGCESRGNKNPNVRFHGFPKPNDRFIYKENVFGHLEKIDRLKAWIIALKIYEVTPNMKVCSLHFKKQDYILPDAASKRRNLKKTAVPSCNLPISNISEVNFAANRVKIERQVKRRESEEAMTQMINTEHPIKIEMDMVEENEEENIFQFVNAVYVQEATHSNVPLFKDAEVQVESDCIKSKFVSLLKNDSELNTATGIESFDILNTIVGIIKLVHGTNFEGKNVRMNTLDRVVMTYVKLKQNLSYRFLAILFNCGTAKDCQRVFYETLKVLSECLKGAIRWPSKEEIVENLPESFQGFENVRVVLDCTEIFIQKPKNLEGSWKILTGITPAGNISFLSKPYTGLVNDSNVFEQSDLTKLLEPGDGVMVNRGFVIDGICEMNRWKCIRPPILKDKKQFTKDELIQISKISKARIHVDRSNRRIKAFQIVSSRMPAALVPFLEDILTVICATLNMSSPILDDQKLMRT